MAAFLARPATAPASSGPSYEVTDCGNSTMKVVVRIRPENETEIRSNYQGVTKVLDEHVLVFDPTPDYIPAFQEPSLSLNHKRRPALSKKHKDLRFAFDRVFDETSTQVDIFEHTTKSIIDGVLDGINCSVFAYGSTGAGKTYTMLGNLENPGVMFLTMMELYRRINEIKDEKTCQVTVSYCEVYNETIRDLLVPSGPLDLREDTQKGLVVNKLTRYQPKTANEILSMLEIGNRNRTQHPTDANATSSRSHAVFQVYVHQKARTAGLTAQVTCAKMSLIDLAGSERATVTTNRGMRFREGANINKSLLALGNCINALADNKGKLVHVPYRNSKLTRLLKDSLGGNCRTVMIANVSPSGLSYEDTYNTLKYADRAKQIKTKLVRNVLTVDFHLTKYRTIVQDLQREIAELKSKLEINTPKQQVFDPAEATRLQGLLQSVYGERSRLRKHMADLDASERDTLLKVCRKERELQRIDALTGNGAKKTKVSSRLETLRHHVIEIQRQKQTVHEYLFSNNESIGRIQAEVNMACNSNAALRQLMEAVTEAKKLEAENAHQWKQTKHLLKYIKNQEKEVGRNERILVLSLELVRRQHAMLRASNALTPNLQQAYDTLIRLAEGDKGVAWADQSMESLHDVSLAESQQALFESFLVHASPARRNIDPCGANSPSIAASLGILTATTTSTQVTASSKEVSSPAPQVSKPAHPLFESRSKMGTPIALSPLLIHSSSLPTRDTPIRIPNKPRRPTPADDSSSSACSTYTTRFNTVLNTTNTKSSPITSHLVRNKSYLISGSSLTRDTQPLPLGQPSAKPATVPCLPYPVQQPQSVGTNTIDTAQSENAYTASFSNQPSAKVFNAFEDNFVPPKVSQAHLRTPVRSTTLKRSPLLQNLPDHALQPTPLTTANSSTSLLCRPMHSPVPTFKSSLTSIPNQLQRGRSSFVPVSHVRANHSETVVSSSPREASSHISLSNSKPKAVCEENRSLTTRNSCSSVAFTPLSSTQRNSAFNPVPPRTTQSPSVNPSAFNPVPHKALNNHIVTTQQPKPNPSAFSLVPQNVPMSPRGRITSTHSHYQHVMLGQGGTAQGMSLEAGLAGAMEDFKRHSSVASIPSSQRSSTDTLYSHRRRESAELVPVSVESSHPGGASVDVVCEQRKQQSSDQSSTLCSQKGKRLPDTLYKHGKDHSNGMDRQRGVLDTELNSTFTIERRVQSAPVVTAGSKHPTSMFSVSSSNPLAQLHVNSPQVLEERSKAEEKKLPSYLQMTKSASSKRVLRAHNKENQSALNGKLLSKSKHKHHVHSTRSASIKAPSLAPQLVW